MKKLHAVCLAFTLFAAQAQASELQASAKAYLLPAAPEFPADNTPSAERILLGKKLFFDPRLSGSNWLSCASCHNPVMGWTDGLPVAIGEGMKQLRRNTPTVVNNAYNSIFMWDGRKATLEDQALGPIVSPDEMNQDLKLLVDELKALSGYVEEFEAAYPGEGVSSSTIGRALASYERTILSTNSAFDRWAQGDASAISESAQRGFALFQGKAECAKCHMGPNFTDNGFHNIGLKNNSALPDVGRFSFRPIKISKGAFKTPTLRDVRLTAPYMHDGSYKTLADVVEHYVRGGDSKDNLDPNIHALELSEQDKADLVAFMESLTGEQIKVELPLVPYK